MKNIQELKRRKLIEFAKKYYEKKIEELNIPEFCFCSSMAEVFAYIEAIIPESYQKFTIFNFQGFYFNKKSQKKILLPKKIALRARDIISQYCWGRTWTQIQSKFSTNKKIKEFLNKNSIMLKRLRKGNSVIIFGDSAHKQIGRTLVASIIMKEAIKSRLGIGQKTQTYNWIDFAILKDDLIKNSEDDINNYRSASWLVVDNIDKTFFSSERQKAFISEVISPLFLEKHKNNMPVILVFQFDIRKKSINLRDELGSGIAKIVNSRKTFKIPLSELF